MPMARLVTGTLLALAVLASIYLLPPAIAAGIFLVVVFAAALEWAALSGLDSRASRIGYGTVVVVIAAFAWYAAATAAGLRAVLVAGCAWWSLAVLWVLAYQRSARPALRNAPVLGTLGVLVLAPALAALAHLLTLAPGYLLALLAIVWSADILAYAGGRRFGKHRLASRVSPGKTWEGLLIAAVGTLALGLLVNDQMMLLPAVVCAAVILLTFVAAVVGDLLESLVKRLRGVKDSGTLLPGHGGLLDRIDSLVAAAPVYTLALYASEQT